MGLTSALSPRRILESQQASAYMWLVVAFGAGIATYFGLSFEPSSGPVLLVFGLSGLLIALLWKRREEQAGGFALACLVFFFVAGVGVSQIRAAIVHTPMILKETGPRMVEGTIHRIDMMGEGGDMRFVLRDPVIERVTPEDTPKLIRLRVRDGGEVMPGQRVSGLAALNPPSPPVAPGAFDFQRMAYFQSIGAVGFFYRTPEIIAPAEVGGLTQLIEGWRIKIAARVSEDYNQPQAGLMIALLTGQQRAVAEEDYQAMRDSGLAHLLAISGMNVAMIATTLFFASRLLMAAFPAFALRHPIKKYAAVIAFFGALIYTMVAGMSVPTQRAILMTGIVLLAVCLDRSPFSLRLFAFAAMAVMIFTPENMMGVSFQMSFAAVMGLIVFYEWARPFWTAAYSRAGWMRKAFLYFLGVIVTTIIGGTVTGIYALYHFQSYPLYTLLANLIVVPLTGAVIMPCAVAAMALMPLGLDGIFLKGMAWGVEWMLAVARWVAGMDGSVLHIPAFSPWLFAGITAGLLFFMIWQGRARFVGFGVMVVLLILTPLSRAPDVLVNGDASLVALRNQNGLLGFSKGRGDSYAAETWLRRNGEVAESRRIVWPKEGADGFITCDDQACRYSVKGQRVSILRTQRAIAEECHWAGVVIANFPVRKNECPHPYIIDRFAVWREGAHSLTVHHGGVALRTVERERGNRPWTQTAGRNRSD